MLCIILFAFQQSDTKEEAARAYDAATTKWMGLNFDDNGNNMDLMGSEVIERQGDNSSSSLNQQTINDAIDFQLNDNKAMSYQEEYPEQSSSKVKYDPSYDNHELLDPHVNTSSLYDDLVTSNPFLADGFNHVGAEFGIEGNDFSDYGGRTFPNMDATKEESMLLEIGWESQASQAFQNNEEFYDNQLLYQNNSPLVLNNNQGLEGNDLKGESSMSYMTSTENQEARSGVSYDDSNLGMNLVPDQKSCHDLKNPSSEVQDVEVFESLDDFDTDQFFLMDQENDLTNNLDGFSANMEIGMGYTKESCRKI